MIQHLAQVLSNRELMSGVHLVWLQSSELARQSKPGQFVMVKCGSDTILRRPLSIHRVNEDKGVLALLFANVGKGTDWLATRQKGETLDMLGPLGNGFSSQSRLSNKLLIAGGIGIAPLCYLVETLIPAGNSVTLLAGAATADKLFPATLLPSEINLLTATEDGKQGHKGLVTDLIVKHASAADEIFICGPMAMLKYVAINRGKLGLEGKPVYVSLEMRMACGLGVCYGCTIRTKSGLKQVCKDGPVFALDEIVWDELARG